MGVSYEENSLNHSEGGGYFMQYVPQAHPELVVFHHQPVYNECSYVIDSMYQENIKRDAYVLKSKDTVLWSVIDNSTTKTEYLDKHCSIEIVPRTVTTITNVEELPASEEVDVELEGEEVTLESQASVIVEDTATRKCAVWGWPRLFCPCCTGGGDDEQEPPRFTHSIKSPLPSLTPFTPDTPPTLPGPLEPPPYIPSFVNPILSLELDPSLFSLLHYHGKIRARRMSRSRLYKNILKGIIRNSFKNTFMIFSKSPQ